jgi:hypothetical protein
MFTWNKDGTPNFGLPVKTGVAMAAPSDMIYVETKPAKGAGKKKSVVTLPVHNQTIILKNKKNN